MCLILFCGSMNILKEGIIIKVILRFTIYFLTVVEVFEFDMVKKKYLSPMRFGS
jgi:hypothetical protein